MGVIVVVASKISCFPDERNDCTRDDHSRPDASGDKRALHVVPVEDAECQEECSPRSYAERGGSGPTGQAVGSRRPENCIDKQQRDRGEREGRANRVQRTVNL